MKMLWVFLMLLFVHCSQETAEKTSVEEPRAELNRLYQECRRFADSSKHREALNHCLSGLKVAEENGERVFAGKFLRMAGTMHYYLGDLKKALEYDFRALHVHEELGEKQAIGNDLFNIGLMKRHLEDYEESLRFFQKALAVHEALEDSRNAADDLMEIGFVSWKLGRSSAGIESCEKARELYKELSNKPGEANALTKIGLIQWHSGQYENAIQSEKEALNLHDELGDKRGRVKNLDLMGLACRYLGNYEKALECFEKALSISVELGNPKQTAGILNNMGLAYDSLGQYAKALPCYEQALKENREIGYPKGEAENLSNMGVVFWNLQKYEDALKYHEMALSISQTCGDLEGIIRDRNNIALVDSYLGDYQTALESFEQNAKFYHEIEDRHGEAGSFLNIAMVHWKWKQYEEAYRAFKQSLEIFREVEDPDYLWRAYRGLGSVEAKLERYPAAVFHYEQALDTIESIRGELSEKELKESFMGGKLFVYDDMIDLLQTFHNKFPSKGYDRKSLEIFERKQGRIFLEEMGKSGAMNFAGIPDEALSREAELDGMLARLKKERIEEGLKPKKDRDMTRIRQREKQIQEVIHRQQTLEERIRTDYPDYYALKYPRPAQLADLQQDVLQAGETILAYNVMKEKTCLWVVSRSHFSLHAIDAGEKTLEDAIALYRDEGIDPYPLLFPEPAQKAISGADVLYIVPTGPLSLFPFETLKDTANRYLIEKQAVAYLSSASLLKILRDAQSRKKDSPKYPLLAFANPVYQKTKPRTQVISTQRSLSYRGIMGGEFEPLPETEDEARAIKDILNAPEESKPLRIKTEASLSTLFSLHKTKALREYRYLVFACHGIMPGQITRIEQPALVLSDPDPKTRKDGFLIMADVFGLSLNADLVALSACNTGRGKSVKGEGIVGLSRAFMYAGSQAVSVSLWSVESKSAKALNVGFFKHLKAGRSRAEALRESKLSMIRGEYGDKWKKPFYWAPVVMFGDGR